MNQPSDLTRRDMLRRFGMGFGALGLGGLFAQEGLLADNERFLDPMSPRAPHHVPRAKHVIHIFLNGGLSQMDTFDYKPLLQKSHGKSMPTIHDERSEETGAALASPFKFKPYGSHSLMISDMFARTGKIIDEVCVINSMHTDSVEHEQARMMMNSGSSLQMVPSMGSWLTYGLGTENQNLPGYVSLCPGNGELPEDGSAGWRSAFLPPIYQGTYIDTFDTRKPEKLVEHIRNRYVGRKQQRRQIELLHELNRRHLEERGRDAELESRIQSYEMAYRMQMSATDAFDMSQEPKHVLDMYGSSKPAQQLLLARRLIERGVRFVQAWTYPNQPFDNHDSLDPALSSVATQVDQGFAALVTDLKRRGLLDDTLIVMCGEFGRMPTVQITDGKVTKGRNHNPKGFNVILAGGGIKPGIIHGATDDIGYKAVEDRVHVHDLHATILHQMGIDHKRLTYRHAGRDFRLTDVAGNVVKEILA